MESLLEFFIVSEIVDSSQNFVNFKIDFLNVAYILYYKQFQCSLSYSQRSISTVSNFMSPVLLISSFTTLKMLSIELLVSPELPTLSI